MPLNKEPKPKKRKRFDTLLKKKPTITKPSLVNMPLKKQSKLYMVDVPLNNATLPNQTRLIYH